MAYLAWVEVFLDLCTLFLVPSSRVACLPAFPFYTVVSKQSTKYQVQSSKNEERRTKIITLTQLLTLIWLKWVLFRNSLRSAKAVVNRIATVLAMLLALGIALLVALGLGLAAYAVTSPAFVESLQSRSAHGRQSFPPAEFIFFSILSLCYLLWATLPLSIGSSRQFDPGNLLLYPISLRKLFALDLVSEVASLQSVFAIPAILALGVGAGLSRGNVAGGLLIALVAALFGIVLSKWISISVGSLLRRKRGRGETLLALIGVVAGLGGALFGQIAPVLFRHADSISALRWTPPGAIAYALTHGLNKGNQLGYSLALIGISSYAVAPIAITYWLSRRAVVGGGRRRRSAKPAPRKTIVESYTGWELPFIVGALGSY